MIPVGLRRVERVRTESLARRRYALRREASFLLEGNRSRVLSRNPPLLS